MYIVPSHHLKYPHEHSVLLPSNTRQSPRLDKMLTPEVRPQIDHLPRTQSQQSKHHGNRKPLNTLIRTLVGISQLLLARPEILHLVNNFANNLLNTLQLNLNRLELLGGLDRGPIARVGANVDIELDLAGETGAMAACGGD